MCNCLDFSICKSSMPNLSSKNVCLHELPLPSNCQTNQYIWPLSSFYSLSSSSSILLLMSSALQIGNHGLPQLRQPQCFITDHQPCHAFALSDRLLIPFQNTNHRVVPLFSPLIDVRQTSLCLSVHVF